MISIIIPTYKNKEKFLRNLKHNLPYFRKNEVIIINDYPEESIEQDIIQLKHKDIKLIENKKNLGFSGSVNIGVKHAKNNFVFLLNNDVLLHDSSYEKSLSYFDGDKLLFGIGFAEHEKDGSIIGKNKIFWRHGFFYHNKASNIEFGKTAWAQGGASMIDKRKFDEIGGLDSLYSPFYWEDIDLSYKAWKAGYNVIFDPKVLVEHHHQSTISTFFKQEQIKTIAYRNQLIFIWKNITEKSLIASHVIFFLPQIIYLISKGETTIIPAFFQALTQLPEILSRRNVINKLSKRTDHEVIRLF